MENCIKSCESFSELLNTKTNSTSNKYKENL
jgi:hypothetical protein